MILLGKSWAGVYDLIEMGFDVVRIEVDDFSKLKKKSFGKFAKKWIKKRV